MSKCTCQTVLKNRRGAGNLSFNKKPSHDLYYYLGIPSCTVVCLERTCEGADYVTSAQCPGGRAGAGFAAIVSIIEREDLSVSPGISLFAHQRNSVERRGRECLPLDDLK
ncbi:hypothetical protein ElyMa_004568400 [Elysia marginata]|uniref:Uncharacterized protein n=1 Tax=Elysia marginata TaxID=1093978 RepID=A0AAV4HVZ7_9GAST|nr:hypothetical protein ElyMa_004568400 [Elysia marginata]